MIDLVSTPAVQGGQFRDTAEAMADAATAPIFFVPGIPLSTVRLLCHCSHRTYKTKRGEQLTQEHLWEGLPCEEDLDYGSLKLLQTIRREGPDDLDLLVF